MPCGMLQFDFQILDDDADHAYIVVFWQPKYVCILSVDSKNSWEISSVISATALRTSPVETGLT